MMVLTSILRRKSTTERSRCERDSRSQSTDTLDQLSSFLKALEAENLSVNAECTRRRLLDLLGNKRQLKLTVKRLSLQGSRLGSSGSSQRSDSPISPDLPDFLAHVGGYESQRSVSTSPLVSPLLSPIMSPTLHRVSFQGSSSDGYEIDVDFMLDSADEPETFIRAPIPKRFRRKNKQHMSNISERDQLMDLNCGQPYFQASAQKDQSKSARSRHCSADDRPTEGHLEVKETHHWITRWVSVRGNIVRIKATQDDGNSIKSVRLAGWIVSPSDEDNKWAFVAAKLSTDEKMMFAAHTRESRDKWIFTLNKCCSNDSLESFRSNSMNGSTITLNTVDKIKDVREEISYAEYKGYLREKTHMFQWTRRYCFVTKQSFYITLSEENLEPLFEILLPTIAVHPDSELKKPYAFRLVSSHLARELFLAAENKEEYDTWRLVLTGQQIPQQITSQPKQAPRSEPAPPAPIPAARMKVNAHTTGLLFRLDERSWVCSWCARHHSNLLLYDSENSALPYNSVKLSGADITTDLQHNVYRFQITPANQDNTLTLGTENHSEFEKWSASFTMAAAVRSRTTTSSSSNKGDPVHKWDSSDYCNTSSAERLDNSNQSLPAERFTSGYGSAESLNSTGTGVYENIGKSHSNRNSSEYEDYVNMGHVPPPVPRRQANNMVEEWVGKVQQIGEYEDEKSDTASQPPELPDKSSDRRASRDNVPSHERAASHENVTSHDDQHDDPPSLDDLDALVEDLARNVDLPKKEDTPQAIQPSEAQEPVLQQSTEDIQNALQAAISGLDIDNADLLSDKEFERLEQMLEDGAADLGPLSKISSSSELLINESGEFPFPDLLDQLDEPKLVNRLSDNSNISETKSDAMPSDIPTPLSEPDSHPSHSSYEMLSTDVSPAEPLEHLSEMEIAEATDNTPPTNKIDRAVSPTFSASSSSSSDKDQADALEDTPKPPHSNVSRLSSLDKLETWDSGMEESLKRTSQFLKEATEEHGNEGLLLSLGSFDDDLDLSSTDLPSPPTSTSLDSYDSNQSDSPAPAPKTAKLVSKLARPSGLAQPSKLAAPRGTGTLKKSATSRSSENVSGLPRSRPTSTESGSRTKLVHSPYGTLPRNRASPKATKLSRSRQNSGESIPGPRASPSSSSIGTGLRKNTSRDTQSGLVAPKKTNTLPRSSRSLGRPTSGLKPKAPGLKVPAQKECVRSRSSSRESVNSSSDRESHPKPARRDSNEAATRGISRNHPAERSMRRRLLSNETSKAIPGIRRLSAGNKKSPDSNVLRSPSYQTAVTPDEPSVPRRTTSLRPSGVSSLPGSAASSPTPRTALPPKSRGSTLPAPARSPSRPSVQSPSRHLAQSPSRSNVSPSIPKSNLQSPSIAKPSVQSPKTAESSPKSILKPPKPAGDGKPKSGLVPPKSGLRTPSSSGLRKPSAGGIPRPSR